MLSQKVVKGFMLLFYGMFVVRAEKGFKSGSGI